MAPQDGKSGWSGRVIAIGLVVGACAIAAFAVSWDRGRTRVGAFYDIAPRLGGIAPVGLANKGSTDHFRVAFQGPEIFAVRRMTAKGGPLPLFDGRDSWDWFVEPEAICEDCETEIYGATMTYDGGEIVRVDFSDLNSDPVQHYTVSRDGDVYRLEHSAPSPDRGVLVEEHRYDAFDRLLDANYNPNERGSLEGIRIKRDERGRVIEKQILGLEKNRIQLSYGEERHPARPTEVAYLTRPDSHGCSVVRTEWDSAGHPVHIRCLDEARQPVQSSVGCSSFEIFWDADNWTTSCLNTAGEPTASLDGWTHLRVRTDKMAYADVIAWLDADGHEVPGPTGASKVHIERDGRGQVLKYIRYAPDGKTL